MKKNARSSVQFFAAHARAYLSRASYSALYILRSAQAKNGKQVDEKMKHPPLQNSKAGGWLRPDPSYFLIFDFFSLPVRTLARAARRAIAHSLSSKLRAQGSPRVCRIAGGGPRTFLEPPTRNASQNGGRFAGFKNCMRVQVPPVAYSGTSAISLHCKANQDLPNAQK